jgi:hypothetical protein
VKWIVTFASDPVPFETVSDAMVGFVSQSLR